MQDVVVPRRLTRQPFIVGIAIATALFAGVIVMSERLLPVMAEVLSPRGINAGFALNLIWLLAGVAYAGVMMWLVAARLCDVGYSPWWAPAAVLPLAVLALVNDAIFLVSRSFVLPSPVNRALIVMAVLVAAWVLAQCLLRPSRHSPDGDTRDFIPRAP